MNIKHTTWNFTPLFASDEDPKMQEDRVATESAIRAFAEKWRGKPFAENADMLFEALTEYEALQRLHGRSGKLGYYFFLRSCQDQENAAIRAKCNEYDEWSTKLGNELQFFELGVSKIPQPKQAQILGDARFTPFKHYLERAFVLAQYLLTEPEEKIMNLKAAPAYSQWVQMVEKMLSKEEREVTTEKGERRLMPFNEIMGLLSSKKKTVRDAAAVAIHDINTKVAEAAEAELNAVLQNKKIDDELRGVPRPDLTRHLADDIDSKDVDTLIDAVASQNGVAARFYALKAKLLGQPKLAYHERNVEYGNLNDEFTFEQSVETVHRVLGKLDAEFAGIFQGFVENGQLDVYPAKGKHGGAYCAHQLLGHPTYILLNFNGKLNDVRTIAHEVGHGINNELMRSKTNGLNFDSPMSTAEVASTFMEDFVLEELRAGADDETRLALMMAKLNDDVSSIFRQAACYRFEQELHSAFRAKGFLSLVEIGKLFQKHMAAYMGEAVEQSPGSENWWVYWSHIRQFFYVYSYASGLLISKSMQAKVKADPTFVVKVKEFLAAGLSDSPKNIFAKLGIDVSDRAFWLQGLGEISALLEETDALAKKLGKV